MKLNEILEDQHSSIKAKLKNIGIATDSYTIREMNGVCIVDVHQGVETHVDNEDFLDGNGDLPFKFGVIDGDFICSSDKLSSYKNFPDEVKRHLMVTDTEKISSFDGITRVIGGNYYASIVRHFDEIANHIDRIDGDVVVERDIVRTGGIGILLIPGVRDIRGWSGNSIGPGFSIIKKYLGRPDDIFECQAELIENGFEEFALL